MSTTVTSKGQVTIPKKVRMHLQIEAGTAVDFELTGTGEVVLRRAGARSGQRSSLKSRSAFARLRGRATVRMRTEEILALTRGG